MSKTFWYRLTAIILFTGLTVLVFSQVFHFGFANIDDGVYVTQNPHVLSGLSIEGLRWAFTSTFAGFWHPLTWLSLMLDAQIYGAWAGGYHLTNFLLHLAGSLVLFMLFYRMTGSFWKSGFVAAMFALHPLHVESVAWIGERKDVLSAFFGVLTLYAYACYVKQPGIGRYLCVLSLFFLGLMSKPMLVTMPFVMLLLDYWPLRRLSFPFKLTNDSIADRTDSTVSRPASPGLLILEKIPLLVMIIPISFVTFLAERNFGALPTLESFPLSVRVSNAVISYIRYIEKTILPINLSVYYPHPGQWPIWQVIIAGVILAALSVWIFRKAIRYPYLTVGWLWYLGTLVPVIGFIQVGPCSIADRYTYIPIIGLFVILAWGVSDLVRRLPYAKTLLSIGAALLLIIFSFLSWQRCQLWGDNYLLWDDVLNKYNISSTANIQVNQHIAFAYNFRGLGHAEKGRYRQAIEDYSTALKINPKYGEALNNRANAYAATGRYALSLADFAKLIAINPEYADAYYNRGVLRLSVRDFDGAVDEFTKAIKINPGMADAYNNRGVALRLMGQYEKAFEDFNRVLSLNHKSAEAYWNRGIIFYLHKQNVPAIANFTEALSIKPQYADAYFYRGLSFAGLEKNDFAIRDFQRTLNIRANYVPALHQLAGVLKKMKRYDEAFDHYKKILLLNPGDSGALESLKEIEKLRRSGS